MAVIFGCSVRISFWKFSKERKTQMTHKLSEPNPIPIFRVVTGIGIAIIALWFLTACVPAKQAQLPTTDWGNCAYAESGEISCDNSQTNVVGTLMVNNFNYRTTI